jgi:hypothetical protein
MKVSKTIALFSVTIFLADFTIRAGQSGVIGTVRTKLGNPLAGVRVFCRGDRETETDNEGQFKLGNRGTVIFLLHTGYKPVILISSKIPDQLEIVMEEAKETEWQIPLCASSEKFDFGHFRLSIPETAKLKIGRDIDYVDFSVDYGSENNRRYLEGIYGPHASSGFPSDDWITSSYEFSSRPWRKKEANWIGVDVRGNKQDGTHWRFVGAWGFQLSYQDAPREASAFFDRIIDSACLPK